jgi:hypothetical protein
MLPKCPTNLWMATTNPNRHALARLRPSEHEE